MAQGTHRPAAANDAVVTFAAIGGVIQKLDSVDWSYSAAPAAGNLKVESPSGTIIFQLAVPASGPFNKTWRNGLAGASGEAIIVTLASGAGAVVGSLNAVTV